MPKEVVRWTLRKASVEEWSVDTAMSLYSEPQMVVRIDEGDSMSF